MKKFTLFFSLMLCCLLAKAQTTDELKAVAASDVSANYTYTFMGFATSDFAKVTGAAGESTGGYTTELSEASHFVFKKTLNDTYYVSDVTTGLYLSMEADITDTNGACIVNQYVTLVSEPTDKSEWKIRIDKTRAKSKTVVVTLYPAKLTDSNPKCLNHGANGFCIYDANENGNPRSWWYMNAWDAEGNLVNPYEVSMEDMLSLACTEIGEKYTYTMAGFNGTHPFVTVQGGVGGKTGAYTENVSEAAHFKFIPAEEGGYYMQDDATGLYLSIFVAPTDENGSNMWNTYITLTDTLAGDFSRWMPRYDKKRAAAEPAVKVMGFYPAVLTGSSPCNLNKGAEGLCVYQANEGGNPNSWWYVNAWSITGQLVDPNVLSKDDLIEAVQAAITSAQSVLEALSEEAKEQDQEDEIGALNTMIEEAQALCTSTSGVSLDDFSAMVDALAFQAAKVRCLELWALETFIMNLITESEFQNAVGCYPVSMENKLYLLREEIGVFCTACEFKTVKEVDTMIASVNAQIEQFYNSKLEATVLPFVIDEKYGLPERHLTQDNSYNIGQQFAWTSPTLLLDEPIRTLRLTVTCTNTGDMGQDKQNYIFALAEFYLYDEEGNAVTLTADAFSSNSPEPTEGSYEGLVDGDVSTYWHSRWTSGGSNAGEHYLEVALPDPMSTLSFGFLSRNGMIVPSEIIVTQGDRVVNVDEFGTQTNGRISATSEIADDALYALYGCNGLADGNSEFGSGFYAGLAPTGIDVDYRNLVKFEKADAGYRIHFITSDNYIAAPDGESAALTYKADEAGIYTIEATDELKESFHLYADGADGHCVLNDNGTAMTIQTIAEWSELSQSGSANWRIYKVETGADLDSLTLAAQITRGNNTHVGAVDGYDTFVAALAAAVAVQKDGGDYKAAADALRAAIDNLGEPDPVGPGHYYHFVSSYTGWGIDMGMYAKKDEATGEMTVAWKAMDKSDPTFVWYLEPYTMEEQSEDDTNVYFAIRSAFYGNYIGHVEKVSSTFPLTDTPSPFTLVDNGNGNYAFKSLETEPFESWYNCMHCGNNASTSGPIIAWGPAAGASNWYIYETAYEGDNVSQMTVTPTSNIVYDLSGRRVENPVKGLYIIGGKKMLVK